MRRIALILALLVWIPGRGATCEAAPPTAELEAREEQAFQQATALVAPAVVKIETVGGLDRVSGQLTATGPTTGVIVAADGWIISSAFNFAAKPEQVLVTLADGRRLPATVVATDRLRMLTLLKVAEQGLPVPAAAQPEGMRVGQWALALGRTLEGDSPSISVGIISALKRIHGKAIQTDAKVSPINYGGPLINVDGQVQGILVPLSPQGKNDVVSGVEWYDSGIGFAIPFADVLGTLDRLKQGQDLLPGLLGITFKSQDEFAGETVLDRVRYGSPAQQAGLKTGDAITHLDGRPITRIAQFRQLLGTKYAGDKISLKARRSTQEIAADLTLAGELVPFETPFLGILPQRLTPDLPAQKGTKIRAVVPDSPAATAGLQAGMVIQKVNDQAADDSAALSDRISRLRPADNVTLTVKTDGDASKSVAVKLGSYPVTVPTELDPAFIPPPRQPEKPAANEAKKIATGLITETFPGYDQDYWAYIPQDYNPGAQYSLLVWLHPAGNTHEAALLKAWKPHCEERGIILLAPKAKFPIGWTPNESSFVKELTEDFLKKYSIDRRRVTLHGMGPSGNLAYVLAFQERQLFRAVLSVQTVLRVPPPDNEPDFRLQFYMAGFDKSPSLKGVKSVAEAMQKLKFPIVYRVLTGEANAYPGEVDVAEFVRWIDSLDRI